uniref:Prolactin releasing hormone 2 n=1 Tax=Latimeria chalumnae TaxID=7897 RepID=H3A8J4_LATCH
MLPTISWFPMDQCSSKSWRFKMAAVYTVLVMLAFSLNTVQGRPVRHQVDNRNPEIDPFWYVGRGVRPIGRFGKRQIKNSSSVRSGVIGLEGILKALIAQEALNLVQSLAGEHGEW